MIKTKCLTSGIVLVLTMAIAGCSMLQPVANLTEAQKQSQIRTVARTSIYIAITEVYPATLRVEKAQELKDQIEDNVIPILLNSDVTFDSTTEQLLMMKVPVQYRVYIMQAVNVLQLYYTTPQVGEALTPQQAEYLLALFQGIVEGCELVIETAPD